MTKPGTETAAPAGYRTEETDRPVSGVKPELVTRRRGKAERRARKLNAGRRFDTYRYDVRKRKDGKWEVVAMQNAARRL